MKREVGVGAHAVPAEALFREVAGGATPGNIFGYIYFLSGLVLSLINLLLAECHSWPFSTLWRKVTSHSSGWLFLLHRCNQFQFAFNCSKSSIAALQWVVNFNGNVETFPGNFVSTQQIPNTRLQDSISIF